MNTFGNKLKLTTFGESHGVAIGGILDGFPAGISIDMDFIQSELDRRKPGANSLVTGRKELDKLEILSGIFDGVSTGTPIGFIIYNKNQNSSDYENIRDIFRPGHADFTYFSKYGLRDHRGGGRASARETAVRVAGGAFAQLLLNELNISVQSGLFSVGEVICENPSFANAEKSIIFSLGNEDEMISAINDVKTNHDSIGSSVLSIVKNVPVGLGEPMYAKLDAVFAYALMGINGVKAVEVGDGISSSFAKGSSNNDQMSCNGFKTNHSGGILGGISTGEDIILKTSFKPTASIFKQQSSLNSDLKDVDFKLKGRHDPCIGVRGSVVVTSMVRLVVADMILLGTSSKLDSIKKIYS